MVIKLEISEDTLEELATLIASKIGGGTAADTEYDVTKQDIVDWFAESDLSNKDVKSTLKEYGYKSVAHIDLETDLEDSTLEDLFKELKALVDDDSEEKESDDEPDVDDIEVGQTIEVETEDDSFEGEVEKVTKSAITVDGDKIKKADITSFTIEDDDDNKSSDDDDDEVTADMVKEALQAFKKEFSNAEYKEILKENKIKKLSDLTDMSTKQLTAIYSELVED